MSPRAAATPSIVSAAPRIAVAVVGLGGQPEADEVGQDHPPLRRQRVEHRGEVVGVGREPVEHEQRRERGTGVGGRLVADEDLVPADGVERAGLPPGGDAHVSPPGVGVGLVDQLGVRDARDLLVGGGSSAVGRSGAGASSAASCAAGASAGSASASGVASASSSGTTTVSVGVSP